MGSGNRTRRTGLAIGLALITGCGALEDAAREAGIPGSATDCLKDVVAGQKRGVSVLCDLDSSADLRIGENDLDFNAAESLLFLLDKRPGDIIAAGSGQGFLRKIDKIEFDQANRRIKIRTKQASVNEAVEDGGARETFDLGGDFASEGQGLYGQQRQALGMDIKFGGPSAGAECGGLAVWPEGVVRFQPSLDLDLQIAGAEVQRFAATATAETLVQFDLHVVASRAIPRQEFFLPVAFKETEVKFLVAGVPVNAKVTTRLGIGYEVESTGAAELVVGVGAEDVITAGFEYTSAGGLRGVGEHHLDFGPVREHTGSPLHIKGYARAEIEILFYSLAGPTLALVPYAEYTGSAGSGVGPAADQQFGLRAGLRGYAGFRAQILGKTLLDEEIGLFDVAALKLGSLDAGSWDPTHAGEDIEPALPGCVNNPALCSDGMVCLASDGGEGACQPAYGRDYWIAPALLALKQQDTAGDDWDSGLESGTLPDPFVIIFVNDLEVARTARQEDLWEAVTFTVQEGIGVTLAENDKITLAVYDADDYSANDLAFECTSTVNAELIRNAGCILCQEGSLLWRLDPM